MFLAWVTNWLPLTLYSWKTISMVQRSKHAPWKCKLEHFGLQKSGAYRMIHSLHNQTELLPEIQLAYKDIHFLENWSSIQIDSFVAHRQRNDSAQLLNRSKLKHLRRYIHFENHFNLILFQLPHIGWMVHLATFDLIDELLFS